MMDSSAEDTGNSADDAANVDEESKSGASTTTEVDV